MPNAEQFACKSFLFSFLGIFMTTVELFSTCTKVGAHGTKRVILCSFKLSILWAAFFSENGFRGFFAFRGFSAETTWNKNFYYFVWIYATVLSARIVSELCLQWERTLRHVYFFCRIIRSIRNCSGGPGSGGPMTFAVDTIRVPKLTFSSLFILSEIVSVFLRVLIWIMSSVFALINPLGFFHKKKRRKKFFPGGKFPALFNWAIGQWLEK